MKPIAKSLPFCVALILCVAAPACKSQSAYDKALEQRARWSVQALDWTQNQDQVVLLSTRVNGPPSSPLSELTVKIVLLDAAGAVIRDVWHTYDLSELPRGGPKDITVSIPAQAPVDGLSVDRVLSPGDQDLVHIKELAGLG